MRVAAAPAAFAYVLIAAFDAALLLSEIAAVLVPVLGLVRVAAGAAFGSVLIAAFDAALLLSELGAVLIRAQRRRLRPTGRRNKVSRHSCCTRRVLFRGHE